MPEAQLDRFMFNLLISYPSMDEEVEIVQSLTAENPSKINPVISKDELKSYQDLINKVPVAENVIEYAVRLVSMTRPTSDQSPEITKNLLEWGAGPRASTFLVKAAQAKCLIAGKSTPDIDDIISVAKPVLRHRIITNFTAEADGINKSDIIDKIIDISKG